MPYIIYFLRLIYITDWFSTFLKLAGINIRSLPPSDSKNVWAGLTRNKRSRRKEIVLNLDAEPQEGLCPQAVSGKKNGIRAKKDLPVPYSRQHKPRLLAKILF